MAARRQTKNEAAAKRPFKIAKHKKRSCFARGTRKTAPLFLSGFPVRAAAALLFTADTSPQDRFPPTDFGTESLREKSRRRAGSRRMGRLRPYGTGAPQAFSPTERRKAEPPQNVLRRLAAARFPFVSAHPCINTSSSYRLATILTSSTSMGPDSPEQTR